MLEAFRLGELTSDLTVGSTCYEGYSLVGPALEEDLIGDINDLVIDVKNSIAHGNRAFS